MLLVLFVQSVLLRYSFPGIVEVSLLDVIRIDLDITNLTNAMATLALSENLISSSSVQAFAVELAGRYRNELHKIFTVKAHDLEAQLEIITGGNLFIAVVRLA